MSFCQRLAKANCFVDWFIILSAQLIKLLLNLWWKISFKWIIYIVYAEIITKAFFRFCVLKLLSHGHIFLITLRIPYSISDLLDRYINGVFSSVQFSHSVVSDSLWPHESQHTRPLCPSPTPGVHSDSRPLSRWCHPAISSSVVPFSSCPQSLPASGSFSVSQLFSWGGQSTGVSALESFLPKNTQDWSPLEWKNGLVGSPCSPRDSQESSPTPQFKSISSSVLSFLHSPTLTSSDFNPQVRWKIQISVEHTYF